MDKEIVKEEKNLGNKQESIFLHYIFGWVNICLSFTLQVRPELAVE